MKIESRDTDIESVLNSHYFHIPRFQRPYSWDEENINDFWEDVVANTTEDYFIGSMVVFEKEKQQLGIVDGQQRLTTITILLCVIRDALLEAGLDDYAKGTHRLIEREDHHNNKNKYVLKTETSFPYFQEHIQKFYEVADADVNVQLEEVKLESAHKQFLGLVNKVSKSITEDPSKSDKAKKDELGKTLLKLRESVFNLKIILITLEKEEDAFVIFETLNTRGKDLALSDLVKNHFSKHLQPKGDVDHTNLKWTQVLETIHNSSAAISTDDFIRHYWVSRYESVTQKKLFARFKKAVTKPKAKSFLDELIEDSSYYRAIYEEGFGWKKNQLEVARSLSTIQLFKLSQPTPAILSLIRAFKAEKIKYAKLRDTLKIIEKFHFQFTAVTSSRSSGGISAMYTSIAQRLHRSKNSQEAADVISDLVKKLRERVPTQDEFSASFSEIGFTSSNSKQKALVQYILREFAIHYKYAYPVDYDELTIEHIHPQSKVSGAWTIEIIGSLGNLIFVDEPTNNKLATKQFKEKQKILSKTHQMPNFIEKSRSWTSSTVKKHTADMAKVAYKKIWKI